jgi:hypothetical protein
LEIAELVVEDAEISAGNRKFPRGSLWPKLKVACCRAVSSTMIGARGGTSERIAREDPLTGMNELKETRRLWVPDEGGGLIATVWTDGCYFDTRYPQ